jgi:LAS superfamily LD-carboxypeptidase LdcB
LQQKRKKRQNRRNLLRTFAGLFSMLLILGASYLAFRSMSEDEKAVSSSSSNSQEKENSAVSAQGDIQKWAEIKTYTEEDIHEGALILVNQKFPCKESSGLEMLSIYNYKNSSYMVSDKNTALRKPAILALNDMLEDFEKAEGPNDILVCSGYRTFDYQETLLSREEEEKGAQEASTWVATPGYSEHHTGYALDFNLLHEDGTSDSYTGTGIYQWVNDHAPEYGYIVRYESEKAEFTGIQYEPWHFRYVGVPHSLIMEKNNFCLEEYIQYLRDYPADGEHLFFEYGGKEYEIYYVKGLEVPIGEADSYLVSGDNVDGFIVTLEREIQA